MKNLNPNYISGFSAGECCFSVGLVKNSEVKTGWEVRPKSNTLTRKRSSFIITNTGASSLFLV